MSLSIGGLLIFVTWSLGAFAGIGFPGFARADETKNLSEQVNEVRATLLAEKIDAVSTSLCVAYDSNLLDYRNSLQREHRRLTGHEHESPPCEVLKKLAQH